MLVPLSWLRDFAPFDLDPVELGEVFDNLGMVVEGMTRVGEGLDGVVVGRVVEIAAIAGADKIRRVVVDAGAPEPVEVVCGAWNFDVGDVVPLATVGTTLPGADFQIGRRKMKGVTSNGMICSSRELALGDDHAGIMVLPGAMAAEVGRPFAAAMGIESDVVYDLAIETNRPDAMSIAGVARDAAAKLGLPFSIPAPKVTATDAGGTATIVIESPDLCDRFGATIIPGVAVGPSPEWIARRLTRAGMRPINNVVDASNYVMLELGQPTHPYDLDRLPGRGLLVRAARKGETLATLDGVERRLGEGPQPDCLICDAEGTPVGIGGIMGGASSEISDGTSTVLLEAAHFERMAIARTSKRLGLRSEASARFERGVDPAGIERARDRVAELLGLAQGHRAVAGEPPVPSRVPVRVARVNAMLGTDLTSDEVRAYLGPIGFSAEPVADGILDVTVPTFRPDAEREVDVIEEVARHHGYERIARSVPRSPQVGQLTAYQHDRRRVRDVLVGEGLTEAIGPMLLGPGDHARAGLPEAPGEVIEAEDPLAREESVLRTSLLPGLLRAVVTNVSHRVIDVPLFEIGHVYGPPPAGQVLPDERERLAAILYGEGGDGRAAADVVRTLLGALRIDDVAWRASRDEPGLHPTRTVRLIAPDGAVVGVVGEVAPDALSAHDLTGRAGWIDLDLGVLLSGVPRRDPAARVVSRFPSSDVDLAFVVDDTEPAAAVERTLRDAAGDLLVDVWLFDVFRGPQVGDGRRSLAYRLRFCAPDRTLTDAEVAAIRQQCIDAVEQRHPATLRA
ncbi:MAG: pheT [Acidimicrobiales bacterium]|nr:pheT [Acidimicrobiales bacterium]